MDDLFEAGRYLFVSGVRRPEYQAAITVFLDRFSTTKSKNRLAVLPGRIHRLAMDDWPAPVLDDLGSMGLLDELKQFHRDPMPCSAHPPRWYNPLIGMGCFVVITVILLLAATGLLAILGLLLGFPVL